MGSISGVLRPTSASRTAALKPISRRFRSDAQEPRIKLILQNAAKAPVLFPRHQPRATEPRFPMA
jgi:hypothetical protein